jgi:hypothetical protein
MYNPEWPFGLESLDLGLETERLAAERKLRSKVVQSLCRAGAWIKSRLRHLESRHIRISGFRPGGRNDRLKLDNTQSA